MQSFELASLSAHLRYQDLPGQGVPMLFLHGLGCASSSDFPRVVRHPLLAGRRALLVDLLGSGYSDRPAMFSYSVEAHARCVVALIEALDLESLDLFGHSAGGAVAIETAVRCPGRVRRMVLSEPTLAEGGGVFSRAVAAYDEQAFLSRGFDAVIAQALAEGNVLWAGTMRVTSPVAVHRLACSLVKGCRPSWREQLLSLTCPRTVLFGERSLPHPEWERLAAQGVRTEVIPGAGHSIMWENPEGLALAVAKGFEG